jgi:hypothetical protein
VDFPGHVAEIVEHREIGAKGDFGDAAVMAGQPVALLEQVAEPRALNAPAGRPALGLWVT